MEPTSTGTEVPVGGDRWLRSSAILAGVVGILSMIALVGFYAFADPLSGERGPWFWLGPANDVLSVAYAPCQIAASFLFWKRLAPSPLLGALTAVLSIALALLAGTTVVMLLGIVGFEVQLAVSIPVVLGIFLWLWVASTRAKRAGMLSKGLALWGQVMGIAVIGALVIVGLGFLFPTGSPAQWALFVAGGVPGAISWVLYPVWWVAVGTRRTEHQCTRHPVYQSKGFDS